jgi:ribosomal protein S18 acetylase RimI-like enzyme
MFPTETPVLPGMTVRHDLEHGLLYRINKVTPSTDGYEATHALNGLRRVSYTQLEDGGFPAGTEWNKDETQFRENFTPHAEIETATIEDLDDLVTFLETAYADTYPNDRGITRDMFENNSAFRDELRQYFGSQIAAPSVSLFIIRHGDSVVGTIGVRPMQDTGTVELWGFYIASSLHGSGLAQQLYERAMSSEQIDCAERIQLSVANDAERARAFYDKMGFVAIREEDWDWPHWTDTHPHNQYKVMQKELV